MASFDWVDDRASLDDLCRHLSSVSWMALDTEFLRERTYYSQLCLIQVATSERLVIVDPLSIEDMEPFYDKLFDNRILKVLHSARQDLELFFDVRGDIPRPVFDTQIGAALLGLGDQVGYGGLVERLTGVSLAKGYTRTNWKRRPLSAAELSYAVDDVLYLRTIWQTIAERLDACGRREWLVEECTSLCDVEKFTIVLDDVWRRVKGARRLQGEALGRIVALARWREETAQRQDLPRKWVLADKPLLAAAREQPSTLQALAATEGIGRGTLKRYGPALLELLSGEGEPAHATVRSGKRRKRLSASDDKRVSTLLAAAHATAEALELSATLLVSREDVADWVRDGGGRASRGWRAQVLADVFPAD